MTWINSPARKRLARKLRFSFRGEYHLNRLIRGFYEAYIEPFDKPLKYEQTLAWNFFNRNFIGHDENGNVFISGEEIEDFVWRDDKMRIRPSVDMALASILNPEIIEENI